MLPITNNRECTHTALLSVYFDPRNATNTRVITQGAVALRLRGAMGAGNGAMSFAPVFFRKPNDGTLLFIVYFYLL